MSQDDTTKYKAAAYPNNNHYSNYYYYNSNNSYNNTNNNNNNTAMKYEHNKRSAAAVDERRRPTATFYENVFFSDDNNKRPTNLVATTTVEHDQNQSAPFNREQRFVSNTTTATTTIVAAEHLQNETTSLLSSSRYVKDKLVPDYENLEFNRSNLQLDKRVLLQKYFRTALVGPRTNIYENLCRGCNYGVFTARGPLCSFCECIVNGVNSISASPAESSNNIYENICENCAQFYSGNEEDCQCRKKKEKDLVVSFRETEKEVDETKSPLKKVASEDCLSEAKEQKVKIRKSKSFTKTNKPTILSNIWDTLRKHKPPKPTPRKPLEIVHNVEGYEQVFHTKETFDLQRICELKRSATSCSDQHIYGRLKQRELVRSQEDFLSTQSLTNNEPPQLAKRRRRISKPKFLRSHSVNVPTPEITNSTADTLAKSSPALQAVYLNNSVCQWMASLRHDINNPCVNTCILSLSDEECGECLCYPKSIPPAKKLLLNPLTLTSLNNVIKQTPSTLLSPLSSSSSSSSLLSRSKESVTDTDSWDSTEIVALRRHHNTTTTSLEGTRDSLIEEQTQQVASAAFLNNDLYQQMVDEFKIHLINKQMKQQQHLKNTNKIATTAAGVNNNNNNMSKSQHSPATLSNNNVDIPLRQAISNHNKVKRQGMYLRLGEQHNNLQNYSDDDHLVLTQKQQKLLNKNNDDHNNNNNNHKKSHNSQQQREHNHVSNSSHNNGDELSTVKPFDSESNSNAAESDHEFISRDFLSRALNQPVNTTSTLKTTDKRSGIHERNILQAFEALLKQEEKQEQEQQSTKNTTTTNDNEVIKETDAKESQSNKEDNNNTATITAAAVPQLTDQVLQPFALRVKDKQTSSVEEPFSSHVWSTPAAVVFVDLLDLINRLQLSCSLNTVVIRYDNNDKQLFVFLRYISRHGGEKYKHATHGQLVRNFQRLSQKQQLFSSSSSPLTSLKHSASAKTANSVNLKLDLMKTNGNLYGRIVVRSSELINANSGDSRAAEPGKICEIPPETETLRTTTPEQNNNRKSKTPPEVPKRDPSTKLSPSTEQLPPINVTPPSSKMTVPSGNLLKEAKTVGRDEESIYQPIWKCKTVGEVQERFKTDEDYYDLKDLQRESGKMRHHTSPDVEGSGVADIPEILISEEDHSEWEPDEEFVFTTRPLGSPPHRTESLNIHDRNSTIRSNRSQDSSIGSTSLSGSTITDFASSTATLASCVSSSLMHHLFRNIGIFYSLSEPKLRAIIYDYDRIHSSKYFAKTPVLNNVNQPLTTISIIDDINDSGLGKSPTLSAKSQNRRQQQQHRSPVPLQRLQNRGNPPKCSESVTSQTSSSSRSPTLVTKVLGAGVSPNPPRIIPNPSVLAWQQQLLNVNYMEDEEDMIVSESEIVRAQKIKEDVEPSHPAQPQQFIQRFKSRSTDNILDLPIEDDKKTITERMRSRLQRGILNINNKSSPKSEKKLYKALRNSQTTSLYLEDGLKPKNPIFAAPLDKLELNQTTCPNVPRFVVDSIEFIERKDRIVQDGLYRACGNKFSIDELKQKLTKSYIYDPKLIAADDIHTITSLLKQFFRDLPHPLIPQETYNCLARDLLKINEGIDTFRIAVNEMPEPNKSTLAFLIKHLTNVAAWSSSNRMNASNLAIVWGPSLFTLNEAKTYDIGRMNTLAKVLIENYGRIFHTNERLL